MKTKRSCVITSMSLLCLLFSSLSLQASSFRSKNSGSWQEITTWEVWNGTWQTVSSLPTINDDIQIQNGHTVNIETIDVSVGSLIIDQGALLRLQGASYSLTINDGNLGGADFIVNGTFEDYGNSASGNGIFFADGGTWQLGSSATIIKLNNSSAARYRDHYEGGMQNIPPTANWIVRYTGNGHPSFSTNGTFYPNLTFESVSGHWSPAIGASRFQGSAGFATVLGDLNVGGNGSGTVTIYNQNTNSIGVTVKGNCVIQSGSTLTNQGNSAGTGFQFGGHLTVNGTLDVTNGNTIFDGFSAQNIQGFGTITLNDVVLNNFSGADLFRGLEIPGTLSLWQGHFRLNQFDLIAMGDIVGASDWTYVKTNGLGHLERPLSGSQTYPIGNDTYNFAIIEGGFSSGVGVRVDDRVLEEASFGNQITENVVNRTWWIEGGSLMNYSLTVEWKSNNELANFDRNSCYISYHGGFGWEQQPTQMALGSNPYLITQSNLLSSGAFAIASNGALPLDLVDFSLTHKDQGVEIRWLTLNEVNFDYFELQRSENGKDFYPIARIKGKGAAKDWNEYSFEDKELMHGHLYYRLKMVDLDGSFRYSEIETIELESEKKYKTYLVMDILQLPFNYISSSYYLINKQGKVLQKIKSQDGILDLSSISSGMYWLKGEDKESDYLLSFIKM